LLPAASAGSVSVQLVAPIKPLHPPLTIGVVGVQEGPLQRRTV
jgi:hypothetical protein